MAGVLQQEQSNEQNHGMSSGCGRRISYPPEIDEELVQYILREQSSGVIVQPDMFRREAKQLIQPYCPDFKASTGWLDKFLTRHKLSLTPAKNPNQDTHSSRATHEKIQEAPFNNLEEVDDGNNEIVDDDEDDDDEDNDEKKDDVSMSEKPVNPERLKAFNMFVRLFIDENLDRLVPISKQPKEKINAIIMSCQRQFPEFNDRARKRIRTYLKSCRRSTRLREPSSKPSMTHIPASQITEVNQILAKACQNETNEAAKRQRLDLPDTSLNTNELNGHQSSSQQRCTSDRKPLDTKCAPGAKGFPIHPSFLPSNIKEPLLKLSSSEVSSVRALIEGYRQSAAFLTRSADELEQLLKNSQAYPDETCKVEHVTKDTNNADINIPTTKRKHEETVKSILEEKAPTVKRNIGEHSNASNKNTVVSYSYQKEITVSANEEKTDEVKNLQESKEDHIKPAESIDIPNISHKIDAIENSGRPKLLIPMSLSSHQQQTSQPLLKTVELQSKSHQPIQPRPAQNIRPPVPQTLVQLQSRTSLNEKSPIRLSVSQPQNIIEIFTAKPSHAQNTRVQSTPIIAQAVSVSRAPSSHQVKQLQPILPHTRSLRYSTSIAQPPQQSIAIASHQQQLQHTRLHHTQQAPQQSPQHHLQQNASPRMLSDGKNAQMYLVHSGNNNSHQQHVQQQQQQQQQQSPHSMVDTNMRQQLSQAHQSIFNFDNQAQQLLEVRPQYIQQRMSPHASMNYHISPASSPLFQGIGRQQSHLSPNDSGRHQMQQDYSHHSNMFDNR